MKMIFDAFDPPPPQKSNDKINLLEVMNTFKCQYSRI